MDGNPFVGPSSVTAGHPLFGRHDEIESLLDLLLADRIVLLYSPSGAGKSSLLDAGLRVKLEQRGFNVSPILRVGETSPPGVEANRYVLSTLLSLEKQEQDPDPDRLQQLARMSLVDGFPAHPSGEVLLFDQFEEVLTADPFDHPAKEEFFRQLGTLLRAKGRWAVLAMREDYLAGLDPFTRYVPTRLSNTFRLKLLSAELPAVPDDPLRGAMEVVVNTAETVKNEDGSPRVRFEPDAAAELISNLRKVRHVQADGRIAEREGDFVEPVQLQVVCQQLWDRLPLHTRSITVQDIRETVNIDEALGRFFTATLTRVANGNERLERDLINLFDQQLITKQRTRKQIRSEEAAHLPMAALVRAHLVRSETRLGTTYELAHDRMIDAVISECDKWRKSHLEQWQRDAEIWNEDRTPDRLARGAVYKAMRRWVKTNPGYSFRNYERDFYSQSRAAALGAAWLTGLRVVATVVGLVAIAAAILSFRLWLTAQDAGWLAAMSETIAIFDKLHAVKARDEAEIARENARALSVTAREQADLARNNLIGLYIEKAKRAESDASGGGGAEQYRNSWIYTSAAIALSAKPWPEAMGKLLDDETLPGHKEHAGGAGTGDLVQERRTSAAFFRGGADGMAWANLPPRATCEVFSKVECWNCKGQQGILATRFSGTPFRLDLTSMAAGANGELVVAVSENGGGDTPPCKNVKVRIDVVKSDSTVPYNKWQTPGDIAVDALATDGKWIVAGTAKGLLWMDSTDVLKNPRDYNPAIRAQSCAGNCAPVTSLAFRPGAGDPQFAAGRQDGEVEFFRIARGQVLATGGETTIGTRGAAVSAIAYWPESPFLATGHTDGTLAIWDLRSKAMVAKSQRHSGRVLAIAFDAANGSLKSADSEGELRTSPLRPEIFGAAWDLRVLFDAGAQGAELRKRLYDVSRQKLGYDVNSDEPVALSESGRRALEYFSFGATEHFTPAEAAGRKILLRSRFLHLPEFPASRAGLVIPDQLENVAAAVVSKKGITQGFTARFQYRIHNASTNDRRKVGDGLRFFYRDGTHYQDGYPKQPFTGPAAGYELFFSVYPWSGTLGTTLTSPSGRAKRVQDGFQTGPNWRRVCVDVSPERRLGACEAPAKATEFQGVRVFLESSDTPALELDGPVETPGGSALGFYATTGEAVAEHRVAELTVIPAGSTRPDPSFAIPGAQFTTVGTSPEPTGYPKFEDNALVLTRDQQLFQASAALLDPSRLSSHYSVEFEFRMRNSASSDPYHTGNGLVFLFAQNRDLYERSGTILPAGSELGVLKGPGYGVYFEGHGQRMIRWIDTNNAGNLANADGKKDRSWPGVFTDGAWRKVRVEIDRENSKVLVYYEGILVLDQRGVQFERTGNAFGFTASTGSLSADGAVAEHAVRNVVLRDLTSRGHRHTNQ